ncbi:MAG TPA: serine/threonine-protein kinase [Polyangiaceae bacterium]
MFPSDAPPRALAGFDILQRLGAGGVGEVFLARSRAGKLVAIKTIADARRDGHEGETADAFAREASVCVRLKHPCIVQVRAFLEEPGFAALVFEYVPGVALARVLRFCQSNGVRMPDGPAWHIVERVLTALAYAHGFSDGDTPMPIVHRDVSPSNVLLDWSGGVKIADFGIAKVLGVSSGTRVGIVKGTLGCMSPEQARGEAVDERADVYAAALLAWRLATGRAPFGRQQKDEFEILRAMRQPRIPPLGSIRPDLPEPLLAAIARALEPERENRKITAAELAETVRAHVDVKAGWTELATLLESWKGALERTVKRAATDTTHSSGSRAAETIRYEEVALAFDEVDPDSPTFEAHALPSDPAMLAALPLAPDEEPEAPRAEPQSRRAAAQDDVETLPALPEDHEEEEPVPQSKIPTVPPTTRRARGSSALVLAFVAVFAIALVLAALYWR